MFDTFINVNTPIPQLPVPRRTHALVGPLRVDAAMMTHVLSCGAFVQVPASLAVRIEDVPDRAVALV